MLPPAAREHHRSQQRLSTLTVLAARRVWGRLGVGNFDRAWATLGPQLVVLLAAAMERAAEESAAYVPVVTAQVGLDPAQAGVVDAAAFALTASDGRPLDTLLYQPVIAARTAMARGSDVRTALGTGQQVLDLIVATQVADAGRLAESAAIAATPAVGGYVRMLNPPSCSRCVILAGKWFRWNQGFARHPRCDCRHIPASEDIAGDLTTDPYAYFRGLDQKAQDAAFGPANAQAIRDGADIYQVVNAGRRGSGLSTLEGVQSRRGYAATVLNGGPLPRGAVPNMTRLTPEGIYRQAATREEALQLLRQNGYLLEQGQIGGGAIGGSAEGFGQLGRGGTRLGARQAVLRARSSGVRDPSVRATMTAAERRAFDAGYGGFRSTLTVRQRAVFDRTYLQRRDWQDAVAAVGRSFVPSLRP